MLARALCLLAFLALLPPLPGLHSPYNLANAYTVAVSDKDELRQTCSGMYAGKGSRIEAIFDKGSTGTAATIFYEFEDFDKLGIPSDERDVFGFQIKTYICTAQAVRQKLCQPEDVGNFITADGAATVQKKRVDFAPGATEPTNLTYAVDRDGYYCFGATAVPLTSLPASSSSQATVHGAFTGRLTFYNSFKGNLPAAEHPKLTFYFYLSAVYAVLGLGWLYLCIRHRDEMLTVQHFISGTIVFLIVEMLAQLAYYSYLNSHLIDLFRIKSVEGSSSVTAGARFLLVLTSILDAAQNSVSFFLLLIVSMGYGVVRPSIGPVMTKVRLLTGAHFVFGVLYSIGIVLLQIDKGGAWIFLFIFPLAMTLTALMMWTMNSLNQSIEYLTQRKQTFKKAMFVKLHRILMGAIVLIFAFFVVSSIAFSQSGGDGFAPSTWPYRWFLLDGWLACLYLAVFAAIAWVWRPTGNNMRLAMSDELATEDDPDAEGFEVDTFAQHTGGPGDDSDDEESKPSSSSAAAAAAGSSASTAAGPAQHRSHQSHQSHQSLANDDVVFEIGDDDEADTSHGAKSRGAREEGGSEGERMGLMHDHEGSQETLVPGRKGGDKLD
ncbi:uncharacterized protein PFL1_03259 [Pseudozyma flocculosa PF-1]|uniref:Intimal thickness related receptor IRP domain-containing protein n=1 Tax=Pseudozyma flocculosa PF-1 TaxID=1277687 RepID=A0A061H932_9BASI|nr:uncharacterized protein PFL1_03259 [Pseudozyma flocculosa PF-1]EPQ28969.1 hypothetical protein PFL1_03259 [Pseudozyma flocculosa PF-1]